MILSGKRALVTGSTSGIGLAVARSLKGEGAEVMLSGFGAPEDIAALCEELDARHLPGDLSRREGVEALMAAVGPVDILVNNAGIQHVAPIEEFPPEKWDQIIALNLTAAFETSRLAVPHMKQAGWGRIINIASAHSLTASPFKAAYVAAKQDGLVIVDITRPLAPKIYQRVTLDGSLNDAEDVIVGSTNASLFAYVADGRNGMKVLQLTSPSSQPNFYGFSPAPKPELIAWAKTKSPAISMSKGLDRDRAVDETGGQMAVFGRLGSRPFTREEMEKLFTRGGVPWKVNDEPDLDAWVGRRGPYLRK